MTTPHIKAIIFDMDGVLIDSEPAWQQAEIKVFNKLGLNLCLADTLQTTGYRIDQVVQYWYQRSPWINYDNHATSQAIVQEVVAQIHQQGAAMNGVIESLAFCSQQGLKIGLATSSSSLIIDAVLTKLSIGHYFDAICSAEHLTLGKPHPEVYLNCAAKLQVKAENCLAIEDSFTGLIAARAANMQTVAIPAPIDATQNKWIVAHHQLNSAAEIPSLLAALKQTQTLK
ncbi:hexitol phosphatase HxpB [Shewanella aestuarii]|uniref:Hexitol phosphatase HxpB n=1 Tax=Shewanella aestuarii TaxID=1028752 RepID=A0A6G9QH02_9GAMM|nr:hexitol phosphatase HxpB [Shewanella aestuarii]QIR13345.1 hexitol phosphatase HxpB [Shewanella aestuarii]